MATGGSLQEINKVPEDYRRSCTLCLKPYRGRNPKLLPCTHSFCLPCLTALVENASKSIGCADDSSDKEDGKGTSAKSDDGEAEDTKDENNDEKEENDHRGDTFLCPLCREPVVIPKGGVAALKNNVYLELEASEDTEPSQCQMCEEKEATLYCQECDQRMCFSCKKVHGRVASARGHNVEPVAPKPAAKKAKNPGHYKRWCQYHPDQVLCFHCCKCDISICLHCKLTSHEGHETVDMVTAARRANDELTWVMSKAKEQVRSVKACISRLERDEQDLQRQKQEVEQQINARYDIIIAWANRAREEVLEVLAAKAEISLSDITMEKTSACIAKETISEVMSRASVKTSYGPDLMLKSELQAALLKDEVADRFKDLAARKEHKTFLTCTADTSAIDLDLLRVYIGDMAEVKNTESAMVLSVREMAAKVTALEAQVKILADKPSFPMVYSSR